MNSNIYFDMISSNYRKNTQKNTVSDSEDSDEFSKILLKFDEEMERNQQRRKTEQKVAQKQALEKKERDKKIQQILGRIAKLRTKLYIGDTSNKAIEAQISALQTELFWLTFNL